MAREIRQRQRQPYRPKPVEKIELSEKHIRLRTVLTFVFLAIGVAFLTFGVSLFFGGDSGWVEIKPAFTGDYHCGDEFTFLYDLGKKSAAEKKAVTGLYSQTVIEAYRLFTADQEFEDTPNVAALNRRPNEEIRVAPGLYRAFEEIRDSGDRSLYLGPIYQRYDDLFDCTDDSETVDFDPYRSPEVAAEYAEAAQWAADSSAVDLELLGDCRVRLKVSPEYLAWAEENGVTNFIDFFWMSNAFRADYIADVLTEAGYTKGCLSSFDGFVRNMDSTATGYSLPILHRREEAVYPAGVLEYTGPAAMAYLRSYPTGESDRTHFYRYRDGAVRTPYVDVKDGLSKAAAEELAVCSRAGESGRPVLSCGELLLKTIPYYVADSWDDSAMLALQEKGIASIRCRGDRILYTDPEMELKGTEENGVRYEPELLVP